MEEKTISKNPSVRSSHCRCSIRKGVLRNLAKFTRKHLRQSLFFNKFACLRPKACNFIEKEILPQVLSCEFCQISKNTFFTEPLSATTSAVCKNMILRSFFFFKNNLLGKALKPPLFCSPFFWLKTYFFNEKKILITVPQFLT